MTHGTGSTSPDTDSRPTADPADPALPWVRAELGRVLSAGRHLRPEETAVEVRRERAWGDIWTVAAHGRQFWFKRPAAALAREVGLRHLLEARDPAHLLPLVAADPERGWMLTEDQGPVLAASAREDGPDHYAGLARALAAVQRALTPQDVETLAAAGMPRFAPRDAVARLDAQLAPFAELDPGHPAHCTAAERTRAGQAVVVSRIGVPASRHSGTMYSAYSAHAGGSASAVQQESRCGTASRMAVSRASSSSARSRGSGAGPAHAST